MKLFKVVIKYKYPLLLLLLTLFFFSPLLLNPNKILASSDIIDSAYFPKLFFHNYFNEFHQIPFWNPYMFSGTPFLANPSSGIFYPLYILFLIMPVGHTFGLIFLIDIFLLGLFTYFFAKRLGINDFSSFISAVIFMFSGPVIYRIFPGHLYILDAITWFPLILIFFEDIASKGKVISGIYASIAISLMILAGHSQFTFYSLFFASLYFLLRVVWDFFCNKKIHLLIKKFWIYILSVAIATGLSSIQLLPSLEFTALSERSGGISYTFASAFSLHPYQIISFLFPFFFGSPLDNTYWGKGNFWELCGYLGIAPLFLSFIAILKNRNKYVLIFSFILLCAILFSFGKYFPLYKFFFDYIPFFNLFRAPARILYIYAFSIALLAGFGINFLINKKIILNKYVFLKRISLLFGITSLIFSLISLYFYFTENVFIYEKYVLRNKFAYGINNLILFDLTLNDLYIFTIIIFSIFLFLYLFSIKKLNEKKLKFFVFAIVFLPLYFFSLGVFNLEKSSKIFKNSSLVNEIKKDNSLFRVFAKSGFYNTSLMTNNIQSLTGYEGIYLREYRDFLWLIGKHQNTPYESFIVINSIENPMILNLLNVKYIIWETKIKIEGFKPIGEFREKVFGKDKDFYLYRNLSYLPRAYFVPNDSKKININPETKITKLTSKNISTDVKILKYSPNKITIDITISQPGYLVLSEIWYPGWKSYDNGIEHEILKTNKIFRTIYLEKGNHRVDFIFKSESYELGKKISLTTLVLILGIILYEKKTKGFYIYKLKHHHLL